MKFNLLTPSFNNAKIPVLIIDDYFDDEQCQQVLRGLNEQFNSLYYPEFTASAKNKTEILKKNRGRFINNSSALAKLINQRFNIDVINKIKELDELLFMQLKICKSTSILLSYYGQDDYYKPHADSSVITIITWFYNLPRNFTGGEFYIPCIDLLVESRYNRTIIFPGAVEHEVKKTNLTSNIADNAGRFSITKFLHLK